MTCGGITFILAIFIGAIWLSSEIGAEWPFWVAVAILAISIAWRIFEYVAQRQGR